MLAITYCAKILEDRNYVGLKVRRNQECDKSRSPHASVIIGQKKMKNRCYYLIRNSYGTSCSRYDWPCEYNLANEAVGIWVERNVLFKNLISITAFEKDANAAKYYCLGEKGHGHKINYFDLKIPDSFLTESQNIFLFDNKYELEMNNMGDGNVKFYYGKISSNSLLNIETISLATFQMDRPLLINFNSDYYKMKFKLACIKKTDDPRKLNLTLQKMLMDVYPKYYCFGKRQGYRGDFFELEIPSRSYLKEKIVPLEGQMIDIRMSIEDKYLGLKTKGPDGRIHLLKWLEYDKIKNTSFFKASVNKHQIKFNFDMFCLKNEDSDPRELRVKLENIYKKQSLGLLCLGKNEQWSEYFKVLNFDESQPFSVDIFSNYYQLVFDRLYSSSPVVTYEKKFAKGNKSQVYKLDTLKVGKSIRSVFTGAPGVSPFKMSCLPDEGSGPLMEVKLKMKFQNDFPENICIVRTKKKNHIITVQKPGRDFTSQKFYLPGEEKAIIIDYFSDETGDKVKFAYEKKGKLYKEREIRKLQDFFGPNVFKLKMKVFRSSFKMRCLEKSGRVEDEVVKKLNEMLK
jgi:hypothetical protein